MDFDKEIALKKFCNNDIAEIKESNTRNLSMIFLRKQ